MRLTLFVLTALAMAGAAGTAQEKGKDKGKPKEVEAGRDDSMFTEPEIDEVGGKKIEYWLEEITSKDPSRQETAMKAVMAFGPTKAQRAVPLIIAELKKHPKVTVDVSVRASGTLALGAIIPAVPKSVLKDKKALEVHKAHIRDAIKIVKDFCNPDKEFQVVVRKCAAQAMGRLAPEALNRLEANAKGELPDYGLSGILAVADDKAWEARLAGLNTLGGLVIALQEAKVPGGPPKSIMALYYKHIKNEPCVQVRMLSVQAVAQIKLDPKADLEKGTTLYKDQLNNLEWATKNDPEPSIRAMAHLARVTVRKTYEEDDLRPLVEMVKGYFEKGKKSPKHPEAAIRTIGAQSLTLIGKDAIGDKAARFKIGNDDNPIWTALIANFDHEDIGVVASSMGALARVYQSDALKPLFSRLHDFKSRPAVRIEAAKAIAFAGKTPQGVDTNLMYSITNDPDFNVVTASMTALGQLYEGQAVAHFAKLLKHADPSLRTEAANAIASLADRAREAAFAAKQGDEKSKTEAKKLQESLEGGLKGIPPDLTFGCKDADVGAATACMHALARVEEFGSLPTLTECLKHSDPRRRAEAARAIASIGPKAAAASQNLQAALNDPDAGVVSAVLYALASIKAYDATEKLDEIASDKKQPRSVQQAARDAKEVILNLKKLDDLKKDKQKK